MCTLVANSNTGEMFPVDRDHILVSKTSNNLGYDVTWLLIPSNNNSKLSGCLLLRITMLGKSICGGGSKGTPKNKERCISKLGEVFKSRQIKEEFLQTILKRQGMMLANFIGELQKFVSMY